MRILQFCNKSPYPPKEGGPIAMNALTQLLIKQGHQVKVLAINTPKYTVHTENIDQLYAQKTEIELVWVDTRFRLWGALKSLLRNTSYHVNRFQSEQLAQKLKELLLKEDFDIVILETVYLSDYVRLIRKYSSAKIILRAHNVEHLIWKQIAKNTHQRIKKWYLSLLAKQLEQFEENAIPFFDVIFCISSTDSLWFYEQNKDIPVRVVPFGVDIDEPLQDLPFRHDNLFSIASMDWYPNLEGIQWFLDNVWKKVHCLYPELVFRIAGRNMPVSLKRLQIQNVEVVGEVVDAKLFMQENGILTVPLWSGSGVRIKIIEAMSIGKVVITTSIGLEGIMAIDKEHVLIANTPQMFVEAVKFCMENPFACEQIGKNARQLIKEKHNNNRITVDFDK
ncbi:MAG: glycosyltransferase family 4 protein [Bacteroidales bacterium]|nr:glycosyltransferase family 4 protein [Bacteroidales bacterium]